MSSSTRPRTRRPLSIKYPGLDRADGSARFGFGETVALATVAGPIEVRLAAEHPARATLEVVVRPLAHISGTESKALAVALRALLTPSLLLAQHPRTLVQLVVQALSPAPASAPAARFYPTLVATMVNAATLALLNAGSVPMCGVVCAAAIGRLASPAKKEHHMLILDPSEDEQPTLAGGGCFAFLFSGTGASLVWADWRCSGAPSDAQELAAATALAKDGAEEVWRAAKQSVQAMGAPFTLQEWSVESTRVNKLSSPARKSNSDDEDEEEDAQMEI